VAKRSDDRSWPCRIRPARQVVGFSDINASDPTFGVPLLHGFLWQNGVLTDLGTTPSGSSTISFARAINDSGQIVGDLGQINSSTCVCYTDTGAFLWQNGVMTNLNTFLPPGNPSPSPFSQLTLATAINRAEQIVGSGQVSTGSGSFHAYLLTPVDPRSNPSTATTTTANASAAQSAPATQQHSISHVVTAGGVMIVIQ
jgi:probable HAF family extracellular repeat protein